MENSELIPIGGELSNLAFEISSGDFSIKLFRLMKRNTELFTLGDSSSVRVETAQELLKSVLFTLELGISKSETPSELLSSETLDSALSFGQKTIEAEIEHGRALYAEACLSAPEIENTSYKDTLVGIGKFFRRYDYRFFAHLIPCDIDYQLSHAVDDSFQGIQYINEYLRRIIIENRFVRKFDKKLSEQLLQKYCSDYQGLLINIFEPICTNAIGLAMLGESVFPLCLPQDGIKRLSEMLDVLSATPAKTALIKAAENVCSELNLDDSSIVKYVSQTAEALFPRIESVLPHGNLGGIFL